ncbi:serine protease inhibitor ecotin [Chryseobacterium sp. Alg-005]|uniref:ecotin family protein n=1 Tax=Chryseobacterium sp. Alg-005 TaxID=3159516 RepID=UPI003555AAEB
MVRIFCLVLLALGIYTFGQEEIAYPEPKEGFKRVDIKLPKIKNEDDYKVEINFSMMYEMLDCEKGSFTMPDFETRYLKPPHAYPYYVIDKDIYDVVVRSKGTCGAKKVRKKIYSSKPILIEYSSIFTYRYYVPENMNVEYRIWKAEPNYIEVK